MAVRLFVEGGPHAGVSRAAVVRGAHAMLEVLQLTNCELSILLTGDAQIAVLNRIYRKKNRPTDVLAFAQREGEHGDRSGPLLGDVVVSVETARRQAQARGAPVASELTMLLAHGLLHLLGWDHETPSKDRRMRRETTRLTEAAEAAQRDRVRRTPVKPFKGQAPPTSARDPAARTSPRPPRARKARPRAEARLSATPATTRGRR